MIAFFTHIKNPQGSQIESKDIWRRVTGIILSESRKMPLEILGCAELEVFAEICSVTADKSNTDYLKLLPVVYEIVTRLSTDETIDVKVCSLTYDG